MKDLLNSVRMRAERSGKHISGAERLVSYSQLQKVTLAMLQRALEHPRGPVDKISISVDEVALTDTQSGQLPDLHNHQVCSWQEGRELAEKILIFCDVAPIAVERVMNVLAKGAAPGGQNMRGAMLIDVDSGERLEADSTRGVRVSRMDLSDRARALLSSRLAAKNLDTQHVVEAITLAAKVINAPCVIAELCWSDDPDYLAGYVASQRSGYRRINLMKPLGEQRGGRAFFVRSSKDQLADLVDWLEKKPFLIDRVGQINSPQKWSEAG